MTPEFPIPKKVKNYTALLTQTGADAPTETILHNTTTFTITWERTDVGKYIGNVPDPGLDLTKSILKPQGNINTGVYLTMWDSGVYLLYIDNLGSIQLKCYTDMTESTPIELSDAGADILIDLYIYNQ